MINENNKIKNKSLKLKIKKCDDGSRVQKFWTKNH